MDAWLEAAAGIATRQDGLITWHELRGANASEKVIASLVKRGWIERVRPGVYRFAGSPHSWRQHLHAAVLAAGPGAAASHSCAASLWEFRHLPYLTYEVSAASKRHVQLEGVHAHRVMSLPSEDVTTKFGVPTTTFERTLLDCTTVLSELQLSAKLDDGLRRRVASLRALRECAERLHSGPGRRLSIVRRLLDARPGRYNPGGSHAERCILDVIVAAGLPAPVQQHRVDVHGRTYYLDYAYPERRLFIEYYGLTWHGTPSAVAYDSDRVSDLSLMKWQPLLFTDATPPRVMVEKIAAALSA